MKTLLRAVGVGAVLMAFAGAALAQAKLVGEWAGKITIEMKASATESAEDAQMRKAMEGMLSQVQMALSMKADKTFKLLIKAPQSEDEIIEGVWSLKENKLTMTQKKRDTDGKPVTKHDVKIFTVEKDGSFWLKFEDDGPAGGKITFVKKKA